MNQQIILAFIPYVVPTLVGLIVYVYHQAMKRLPEKQQQALQRLETIAAPIVQSIEQQWSQKSPEEKKALAVEIIQNALQVFGAATPDTQIINAFIESAVFEMNRLKAATPATQPLPTPQLKKGN